MPAVKYTPILLLEDKIDLKMDIIGKKATTVLLSAGIKIWLLTIAELFVIIASTLLLFLATDFSNSFAIHIFSINLIKENTGSQAVIGTCSDWNLQPFNLEGRRFKSGCWHTIWAGVPLMLRKLKISLASRTKLGSVLIFGKIKKQVKIWSLDDYRYLQSLYTYSITECDFKPQQINK